MFTVCIIDDEAPICDILRRLFQRVGWAATCLTDSTVAYRTLKAAPVDAVLLDLMMPGVDGFGVLAAIRSDPVLANTPVIFYSAVSDEAVKDRARAAGANDYIVKTTPFKQILERLSRYAEQRTADAPQS
jgi:DNA-binding response OmpR family regulator